MIIHCNALDKRETPSPLHSSWQFPKVGYHLMRSESKHLPLPSGDRVAFICSNAIVPPEAFPFNPFLFSIPFFGMIGKQKIDGETQYP